MGIGVDVGVRVSVYFFHGKLIIVVDEAHHISVSIRDKFVISINLSPYWLICPIIHCFIELIHFCWYYREGAREGFSGFLP